VRVDQRHAELGNECRGTEEFSFVDEDGAVGGEDSSAEGGGEGEAGEPEGSGETQVQVGGATGGG
jgi:hypothetical protein